MSKIRVAGIGAGYFSQFHYEAWDVLEDAETVAICNRDQTKAQAMADRFGIADVYSDPAQMLDEVKPDLVDIITPPETHAAMVDLASGRGIPMICQKPLAPTAEEALAIVERAESAGVLLVVHENFRWQPWFVEAKRLIDEGRLGTVYSAHFRLRPGDGQGSEAYLSRQPYFQMMERFLIHETGIHFIDTFRFLLGEVSEVSADLRRLNPAIAGEDSGYVVFNFEDGPTALFDGNRLVDHAADNTRLTMGEMLIEGSDAVLRLDGFGRLYLRPLGGQESEHVYAWRNRGFAGDCIALFQRHVLDHLSGDRPIVNTGRDYLTNIAIEEAVYRSSETGARMTPQAIGP
ncbi:MAG: Gfo/Idh/MocA family oxidoreductase [Pseudomonadota bacterium]